MDDTCSFNLIEKIGSGGFGSVYVVRKRHEGGKSYGKPYIAKMIHKKRLSVKELSAINREVGMLKYVNTASNGCDHCMEIIDNGICFKDGGYIMIMEYIEGFDMLKGLEYGIIGTDIDNDGITTIESIQDAIYLARSIGSAIWAIHRLGVAHRDLKPENLMLRTKTRCSGTSDDNVVIIDFGSSCIIDPVEGVEVDDNLLCHPGLYGSGITPNYISPELVNNEDDIDLYKADVYAFGCILYELFNPEHTPLFDGDNYVQLFRRIRSNDHSSLENIYPPVAQIIEKCIEPDPTRRITIGDATSFLLSTSTL